MFNKIDRQPRVLLFFMRLFGMRENRRNIVNALNTTGDELHIGKRVHVFISEKAALFQAVCAVGIPLFLAGTLFSVIYLRTHSEGFALAGLAGGIAAGVCIAFGINSIVKERALPQIVTIL